MKLTTPSGPVRRYAIGGLVGGVILGTTAAIQNPDHRVWAGALFGFAGVLMGAGLVALTVPAQCELPQA